VLPWQDKAVLVTGGSAGLGLALARAWVAAGARVAIAARTEGPLQAAAESLRAPGRTVLAVPADLTQDDDVRRLIDRTRQELGGLDVLVNNAGRSARGELRHTSAEEFRALLELNLLALVRTTVTALPHLLESRGSVVNIGSLAAKSAARWVGPYAATKFAVAAYSQQLRLELGPLGLHVLLVCPGPIARDEPRQYAGAERLPAGAAGPGAGVRVGRLQPERLAAAVLRACARRKAELVVPRRARLLFAIAQLSPGLGDWLVRRWT
jgi:short-subunit dehydrogenase